MQACPSQRSSRKKWALAESSVSSGSKEGEAWRAEDSGPCDSQVCFDQEVALATLEKGAQDPC